MHLPVFAILTAVTSAFVLAKHDHGHSGRYNLKCHIGNPPPESARCYTKVASTPARNKPETAWTTHSTPCIVTATCITTTTLIPTSIVRSTSTVVSSTTSTVLAPPAFTPVQSSLPGSTYTGSGGPDPLHKRDLLDISSNRAGSPKLLLDRSYPQQYRCIKWGPAKCHTTSTTITSTIYEHASTSLVTTTVTRTSYTAVTTVYAACATNNFADQYQGTPIGEVTGGFTSVYATNTTAAYGCCVAAVSMPDTAVWAFEPNPFPGEGANCFIGQTDGTCPNPASNPSTSESGFGDLVVGNSYCGEITADVPIIVSSIPVKRELPAPTSV